MDFFTRSNNDRARSQTHASHDFLQQTPTCRYDDQWTAATAEPQGLRLMAFTSADDAHHNYQPLTSHQLQPGSLNWTGQYPSSQAGASQSFPYASGWSGTCTAPTSAYTSTSWNPHLAAETFVLPERSVASNPSEYSTTYSHAAISSPFAYSGTQLQTTGSPIVKLETELTEYGMCVPDLPSSLFSHPVDGLAPRSNTTVGQSTTPLSTVLGGTNVKPSVPTPAAQEHPTQRAEETVPEGRRRELTKAEDAVFLCDECGKPFQRGSNLKAHMETHDPHRAHPHVCPYTGCGKSFVRHTDLRRHERSVHVNARDHACPRCVHAFSRKDTLRRHIDDGCPNRPKIKRRTERRRPSSNPPSQRRSVRRERERSTTVLSCSYTV